MFKLMFVFMALFIFTSCSGGEDEVVIDQTLPVTVYFAIEDEISQDHWRSFITISINSDDVVTDVKLNSISQFAYSSRRDFAQAEAFEDLLGYNFYEQADYLERYLIGISRNELVDTIRSANEHQLVDFDTTTFADLAHQALTSSPLPLERGPYLDGTYRGLSDVNKDGLQYFVNLFVINGDIVTVHFNAFNPDYSLKYDIFMDTTTDQEIIAWRHQAQLLEEALIRSQDPFAFSFCEEGFTTDIPGVYIEIESFITLITQTLAKGPITH